MRKGAGLRETDDNTVLILGLSELIVIPRITRYTWTNRMLDNIPFSDLDVHRPEAYRKKGEETLVDFDLYDKAEDLCLRHDVPIEKVCGEIPFWDGGRNMLIDREEEEYACSLQSFTTEKDGAPGLYVRVDNSDTYMHIRRRTGDTTWSDWYGRSSRMEAQFKDANSTSAGGGSWLEIVFP